MDADSDLDLDQLSDSGCDRLTYLLHHKSAVFDGQAADDDTADTLEHVRTIVCGLQDSRIQRNLFDGDDEDCQVWELCEEHDVFKKISNILLPLLNMQCTSLSNVQTRIFLNGTSILVNILINIARVSYHPEDDYLYLESRVLPYLMTFLAATDVDDVIVSCVDILTRLLQSARLFDMVHFKPVSISILLSKLTDAQRLSDEHSCCTSTDKCSDCEKVVKLQTAILRCLELELDIGRLNRSVVQNIVLISCLQLSNHSSDVVVGTLRTLAVAVVYATGVVLPSILYGGYMPLIVNCTTHDDPVVRREACRLVEKVFRRTDTEAQRVVLGTPLLSNVLSMLMTYEQNAKQTVLLMGAVAPNYTFDGRTTLLDYHLIHVVVVMLHASRGSIVIDCLSILLDVMRHLQQAREVLIDDRCGIVTSVLPLLSKYVAELVQETHVRQKQLDIVELLFLIVSELIEASKWLKCDNEATANMILQAIQAELSKGIYDADSVTSHEFELSVYVGRIRERLDNALSEEQLEKSSG